MIYPSWLKQKAPNQEAMSRMRDLLAKLHLNTVCEEAHCPNIGECYIKGTATVMILGDRCTRNCGFCKVTKMIPLPADAHEPKNVATLVDLLALKHVVITSVTRDDLIDGGSGHFAATIQTVRKVCPGTTIEVLIPDFQGNSESLRTVVDASPDLLGHNMETVPRLYPKVRPQAEYKRSLALLENVKNMDETIYTKSGIMLGLGETFTEVVSVMQDLRRSQCDILTIGQYLSPSSDHLPIAEFIAPEIFESYKVHGQELGFRYVESGPLVRSSYHAEKFLNYIKGEAIELSC
jgi:lipoyl synthase